MIVTQRAARAGRLCDGVSKGNRESVGGSSIERLFQLLHHNEHDDDTGANPAGTERGNT